MRSFVVTCLLLLPATLAAEATPVTPLAVGSQLPALRLEDQHGVEATVGAETRYVIFTRDMDAADVVKEAYGEEGAPALAASGAVYVSDISAMPAVITRLFALPAMRKRPYRMLLDTEGEVTAAFPSEEGKVTVMRVDELIIRQIEYPGSVAELRAALTPPATPAP